MKSFILATLAGVLAVSLISTAVADDTPSDKSVASPHINKHQRHQAARIADGVKSGELTRRERGELTQEQREIRRQERQYKSDGKFTQAERKDIRDDQRDASREIREEKNDEQNRPRAD